MKSKYSLMMGSTLLLCASVLTVGCSSSGGGDSGGGVAALSTATTLVGGTTGSGTGVTAGSSGAFTATDVAVENTTDSAAVLIVDKNDDGLLDETDFIYTAPVLTDGSFSFGEVTVNETKPTKAQLTVAKEGYAPVVQTLSLTKDNAVSILAEIATKPILTQVIELPASTADRANTFLKFGVTSGENGISSFSKLMTLSELKAEADLGLGEGTLSESTIPTSAFAPGVTSVTANLQTFDSTNADDIALFPGAFSGHGKPGITTTATTDDEEKALESAAFDLIKLTDQNGDDIELQMASQSKLLTNVSADTCSGMYWVRRVNASQAEVIEAWGDDDNNASNGFQVPIWSNDNSTGTWSYVGLGDWDATSSSFSACVDQKWQGYLNCDSSINVGNAPKELCVYVHDQNGELLDSSIYFKAQKGTTYSAGYVNSSTGMAQLDLAAGVPSDWNLTYRGSITGWSEVAVDTSSYVASTTTGCDYDLNVTVDNPYSAQVYVFALDDANQSVPNVRVTLNSNDYRNYYSKSAYTNAKGYTIFKVKPNVTYVAGYLAGTSDVNVNGVINSANGETADSGTYASVNVQDESKAPTVVVSTRNNITDNSESLRFYVSARDVNNDTLTLQSLKLNGTVLVKDTDYAVIYEGAYAGRLYMSAILDLNASTVSAITPSSLAQGNYTLTAEVSDGKLSASGSQTINVAANHAPSIGGLYIVDDNYNYYYKNSAIPVGDYYLNYYAYDRDGDTIVKTMQVDDVDYTPGDLLNLTQGDHNITVSASDGTLTSAKEDHIFVGNHAPVINSAGATSYLIDINRGDTFRLFAYVSDKEGDPLTVVATDDNGTEYNLTRVGSYGTKYQTTNITLTEVKAQNNFTIIANDGENNSTQSVVTVESIAANQAPKFTKALTDKQVNVNEAQTFECEATDPEGTFVSYTWTLNNVNLSETGTTLEKTFTATGSNTLSCTATDEDGQTSTSRASILVIDPNVSGELTIHAKYEGLVVAVHNSATYKITSKKLTDANGDATFSVQGDRTTFSVTSWPGIAIHKVLLMDLTKPNMVNAARYSCDNNDSTECTNADWCALMDGNTIPNWVWDAEVDEGGDKPAASDVDADANGIITETELYNAAILVLDGQDGNNDGILTYDELNGNDSYQDRKVEEQMYANLPVGEYYIHMESVLGDNYGVEGYYYDSFYQCGQDESFNSLITLDYSSVLSSQVSTISNRDAEVRGSGYGSVYNQAIENNDINVSVYTYAQGANGKYTYLIRENENGSSQWHYYLLNDKTKAEMDANVTVDVSQFSAADTNVSFIQADNESISLYTTYQGLYMDNSRYVDDEDGNSSTFTREYYTHDGFVYLLDTYKYDNTSGNSYNTYNYYGDSSLQTTYNVADYPSLDVAFNVNPNDHSWTLTGNDMNKLNVVAFSNRASSSTKSADGNISYNDSFYINVLWTVAPSQVPDVDLQDIVPAEAYADVNSTVSADNSYEYMSLSAQEFKGQTEASLLNLVLGSSSTVYSEWSLWENGVRSVDNYGNSEYSAASTEVEKVHRTHSVFGIKLNASNAFTK